jgi:hypothetical protein
MARVAQLVSNNSPAILTAVAVSGTVATAVLTGKASFKAAEILSEYRDLAEVGQPLDLDKKEAVKMVWKLYIPPAAALALTISSVVLINQIGTRRAAGLAAAYGVSEKAFSEYKDKVAETIGKQKEQKVRDDVAQDKVTKNPPPASQVFLSDESKVLCYESYTGRYFQSSMEDLKAAQNNLNYQVNNQYYASLSDFFDLIGLERTKLSDEVGWNSDELLEISFSTTITEHSRPCLVLDFKVVPIRDYSRVH